MKKLNTLSKAFNPLQLTLSLLIVLLISCNKENFLSLPTTDTEFSVNEAETWYKAQIKSETNIFTKLQPVWDKARFAKSSNAENFLIIPVKQAANINLQQGNTVESQQFQLRIFKDELNKFQGRIVQISSEQSNENLSDYTLPNSFSGRVFFRSVNDGKLLFGYRYEKGSVTYKISPTSPNARMRGEICDCRTQYYFTCYCQKTGTTWEQADVIVDGTSYMTGCNETPPSSSELPTPTAVQMGYRCSGWENNGSDTIHECRWVADPITGDPGTGTVTGASGSTSRNLSGTKLGKFVSTIESLLKNPCFVQTYNDVVAASSGGTEIFGEQVGQMMFNLMSPNSPIKIYVEEGVLNGSTDGDYLPGANNGTITLNTSGLGNASKEYIAATIIHELVHGYYNVLYGKGLNEAQQHNDMAVNYVQPMAQALEGIYGMSHDDAVALAWGGLYTTPSFIALSQTQKNQIITINGRYRSGQAGHRNC